MKNCCQHREDQSRDPHQQQGKTHIFARFAILSALLALLTFLAKIAGAVCRICPFEMMFAKSKPTMTFFSLSRTGSRGSPAAAEYLSCFAASGGVARHVCLGHFCARWKNESCVAIRLSAVTLRSGS